MMQVAGKVQEAMGEETLDAIVCVAGGWAGGNAASPGVCTSTCPCKSCSKFMSTTLLMPCSSLKYPCLEALFVCTISRV